MNIYSVGFIFSVDRQFVLLDKIDDRYCGIITKIEAHDSGEENLRQAVKKETGVDLRFGWDLFLRYFSLTNHSLVYRNVDDYLCYNDVMDFEKIENKVKDSENLFVIPVKETNNWMVHMAISNIDNAYVSSRF